MAWIPFFVLSKLFRESGVMKLCVPSNLKFGSCQSINSCCLVFSWQVGSGTSKLGWYWPLTVFHFYLTTKKLLFKFKTFKHLFSIFDGSSTGGSWVVGCTAWTWWYLLCFDSVACSPPSPKANVI